MNAHAMSSWFWRSVRVTYVTKPKIKQAAPASERPYFPDVTDEVVREIQAQADKDMAGGDWVVIDGYDPSRKSAMDK